MPKMPGGKAAGVQCAHLTDQMQCELFGSAERPAVCSSLRPSAEMCGSRRTDALAWLTRLECETTP